MIVQLFWLWTLAPRVQFLFHGFWTPFCRVSIPNLPLPIIVFCLGSHVFLIYMILGGNCRGSLRPLYNGCLTAILGIDVHLFILLISVLFNLEFCCMDYLICWLRFCFCYFFKYALLDLGWMALFYKFLPTHIVLWSCYLGMLVVQYILICVWYGWQVHCATPFSFQPPTWRHHSQIWLGQSVNKPREQSQNFLCLIFYYESENFFAEKLTIYFVYPLSWTSFYHWLSLSQAGKHAHEHVILYTCDCWHLDHWPRLRDEVKEECSAVYDELLSETQFFCLFFCPCVCPSPLLCSITAHHNNFSASKLLVELGNTVQAFVSSIQDPYTRGLCFLGMYSWQHFVTFCIRGQFDPLSVYWILGNLRSSMLVSQIVLSYSTGYALVRVYYIQDVCRCCNYYFISNFGPHLSVLGPCLLALGVHHMMLGTVHFGLRYIICLFLVVAVVVTTP